MARIASPQSTPKTLCFLQLSAVVLIDFAAAAAAAAAAAPVTAVLVLAIDLTRIYYTLTSFSITFFFNAE